MTKSKHFAVINLLASVSRTQMLGLLLLSLHGVLITTGSLLWLILPLHLSLFLFWQPIWPRDHQFHPKPVVAAALFFGVTIPGLGHWFEVLWSLLLIGLIASASPTHSALRKLHILGIGFIIFELFLNVLPSILKETAFTSQYHEYLDWGLIAIPVIYLFFIKDQESPYSSSMDIFRGFSIAMIILLLILSTIAYMHTKTSDYPTAIFFASMGMALFLLIFSWLWIPNNKASSLSALWARHLLNQALPTENWLPRINELISRRTRSTDDFMVAAFTFLFELPFVSGIQWTMSDEKGLLGKTSKYRYPLNRDDLQITVYSDFTIPSTSYMHLELLFDVLYLIIKSRINEKKLADQATLKGIYETGAKLTHDIKNILQATKNMTALIDATNEHNAERGLQIIRAQIPQLRERLEQTLKKLSAPESGIDEKTQSANDWLLGMENRYLGRHIKFTSNIQNSCELNKDLFDTVAENLLENARIKRVNNPNLIIRLTLETNGANQACLEVIDDGHSMPEETAKRLFKHPVDSRNGLGVGLYQCSRLAQEHNYTLELLTNRDQSIRFRLRPRN